MEFLQRTTSVAVTFLPHLSHSCSSPSGKMRRRSSGVQGYYDCTPVKTQRKSALLRQPQRHLITVREDHAQVIAIHLTRHITNNRASHTRHDNISLWSRCREVLGAEPGSLQGVCEPNKGLWLCGEAEPVEDPWWGRKSQQDYKHHPLLPGWYCWPCHW